MKLAEALAQVNASLTHLEALRQRARGTARYQEGDDPAENLSELLAAAGDEIDTLTRLTIRVNVTNLTTTLEDGRSLTEALAARKALKLKSALYTAVADVAAGRDIGFGLRTRPSELRMIPQIPPAELRRQADEYAQQYRELDTQIQALNWATELIAE